MSNYFILIIGTILLSGTLSGCSEEDIAWLEDKADYKANWQRIRYRIKQKKNYKNASLALARENRKLRIKSNKMLFEIQELKAEITLLKNQKTFTKKLPTKIEEYGRKIAGTHTTEKEWNAEQAFLLAENEFKRKNYSKAFEHFQFFAQKFPQHKRIDDRFLFRTGLSGFEIKRYNKAAWYFEQLVNTYPRSKLYRSSKLWAGLCHYKMGNRNKFIKIAKEFKNKYQNTPEWKVLEAHYEKIIHHKS